MYQRLPVFSCAGFVAEEPQLYCYWETWLAKRWGFSQMYYIFIKQHIILTRTWAILDFWAWYKIPVTKYIYLYNHNTFCTIHFALPHIELQHNAQLSQFTAVVVIITAYSLSQTSPPVNYLDTASNSLLPLRSQTSTKTPYHTYCSVFYSVLL